MCDVLFIYIYMYICICCCSVCMRALQYYIELHGERGRGELWPEPVRGIMRARHCYDGEWQPLPLTGKGVYRMQCALTLTHALLGFVPDMTSTTAYFVDLQRVRI